MPTKGMGRALDTHIRNLRRKIEARPGRTRVYIQTVYGVGYRLAGEQAVMNRLWVRLSLMISGVLFLVFFMQFLSIMLPDDTGDGAAARQRQRGRTCPTGEPPPAEIARRLLDFVVLSLAVGVVGGCADQPRGRARRSATWRKRRSASARAIWTCA